MEKALEFLLAAGGAWAALSIVVLSIATTIILALRSELKETRADLAKCWAGRHEDEKAMGEIVRAQTEVTAAATIEAAARTRANEATARAQELGAVHTANLTAKIDELRAKIEEQNRELANLRGLLAAR